MKVFLTGANDFIDLPTIRELIDRGHHVLALTRSDASADKILSTYPSMYKATTIIHGSTSTHDFVGTAPAARKQRSKTTPSWMLLSPGYVRTTVLKKPLIVAGGCASLRPAHLLKPGHETLEPLREDDEFDNVNARAQSNEKVLHAEGIRGIVMRLAPTVHGNGDPNFVTLVKEAIAKNLRAVYLGPGTNR